MEKCTFCVQRIQVAKIKHKNAGERTKDDRTLIPDGTIKSACQQACPAEAIVFGDLNDKESRVTKLFEDSRSYFMLAELNVRPRVSYMAKIRNPHPDLMEKSEAKNEHAGHGAGH
jgi:molybdopterin-containing oxidoreductase family iron-sulfur binding subunit